MDAKVGHNGKMSGNMAIRYTLFCAATRYMHVVSNTDKKEEAENMMTNNLTAIISFLTGPKFPYSGDFKHEQTQVKRSIFQKKNAVPVK